MTKYYGKLAYIGAGKYGTIVNYFYSESASGKKAHWEIRPIGEEREKIIIVTEEPLILTSVKFARIDNVVFCAAVVNGETLPGYAICAPRDRDSNSFGRRLALARAVDKDGVADLLDEDFFDDYVEEYGTSEDNKAKPADETNETNKTNEAADEADKEPAKNTAAA